MLNFNQRSYESKHLIPKQTHRWIESTRGKSLGDSPLGKKEEKKGERNSSPSLNFSSEDKQISNKHRLRISKTSFHCRTLNSTKKKRNPKPDKIYNGQEHIHKEGERSNKHSPSR